MWWCGDKNMWWCGDKMYPVLHQCGNKMYLTLHRCDDEIYLTSHQCDDKVVMNGLHSCVWQCGNKTYLTSHWHDDKVILNGLHVCAWWICCEVIPSNLEWFVCVDIVSGSYPLQLQGRPTCPRGWSAHTRGRRQGRVNPAPSWLKSSQDKAEDQVAKLTWYPTSQGKSKTRRPHWDGSKSEGDPQVIDKTKEIQAIIYPVYKVPSLGQVVCTDQHMDHLTNTKS